MKNDWKFDSEISPIFDEHVRQHVPMYDEIHRLIVDISGWFLEDGTNVYDIGTSTGQVIHNLKNHYTNRQVNYIGIDNSKDMILKAKEKFKGFEDVNLIIDDVNTDKFEIKNASLITSVLTIQFLTQKTRKPLLEKIHKGLNDGGAFIFVEKIVGSNARFNEIWIELYHELKRRNGLTNDEIHNKSKAIRGILKPYTVDENIELLKEVGFRDIDMFFKWNNFVGFIALK